MTGRDRLWISLRHMRSGVVGVLLVILATAVGVALAASTSAFMRAYREQTKRLLNHPVYREVAVEVLGAGETEITTPVMEIEVDKIRGSFLSMDDMRRAAESTPVVEYAYVLERDTIMTTAALMRYDKGEPGKGGDRVGSDKEPIDKEVPVELPLDEFPGIRTSNEFFAAYGLTAADGFLFTREDLDSGNPVVVLGSTLAKTLFPDGGAVGSRISLWFETFTVVGVLDPSRLADPADLMPYNQMAFMPQETLEMVWNKRVPITNTRFASKDSSDTKAAVNQLRAYFESAHPDARLMIAAPVERLHKERRTLNRIIVVLVFLTVVGLFIAAINLLNLMLIRIIKHTKGIGIMRALGSTRQEIFRQFMNESTLMCVAGAVIGVIVSPHVFALLQTAVISGPGFASQTFRLDLIAGAVVGLVFSVGFGLYPAILAKNTNTTAAIRAE